MYGPFVYSASHEQNTIFYTGTLIAIPSPLSPVPSMVLSHFHIKVMIAFS